MSRRAAANAQLSLAEAAESASDSVALRQVLSEVPEDLRTPDWDYFQGRIDTCTFSIPAPRGKGWKGLEDLPSDPERMLALRSDGEVFAVNVNTGTIESLWKLDNPSGNECGPIGVSRDGELVAIGYFGKDLSARAQVKVCKLQDGSRVAQFSGPERLHRIFLGGSLCILQSEGSQGDRKTEVWDHTSAQLLWDVPVCVRADFSGDQKTILLLIGHQGEVAEKREAFSGKVLSEGAKYAQRIHTNWPGNAVGSTDWSKFFSPEFGYAKLRMGNPWTGRVEFEVAPRYGNYACALIPPGDVIAILGRTSAEAAVVEIRSASTGMLSRSLPVLVPLPNQASSASLRAKQGAIVLRSANALKIWRMESLKPSLSMPGNYATLRRGDTSQFVTQWFRNNLTTMQLRNGGKTDSEKRVIQEIGEWKGKNNLLFFTTPDGSRWLAGGSGIYGAYLLGDAGLEELWAPRKISGLNILPALGGIGGMASYAIHPIEDRLWTGNTVYEFSTGQKLLTIADREGLNAAYSAVWVGTNRVAEIAFKDAPRELDSEQSTGEKVQIVLWDTETGRLAGKAKASNASWLSVSPDGLHLAEAGADKRVRIRNSRTLEVEREFRAHEDSVTGVAWHPNLPLLVTASKDGCIRIWNRDDFRRVEEFVSDPTIKPVLVEIPPSGLELNEVRDHGVKVYQPKSFQKSSNAAP
jgi:WD40 repeat protein